MMISIKTAKTGAAALTEKDFQEIFRENLEAMGKNWISEILPVRYSTSGQNIYHLQQRKGKYVRSAKKRDPSWRPLVLTGKLAGTTQQTARAKASKGGELECVIAMQRGHPTQRFVSEELTETTKKQIDELAKEYQKDTVQKIQETNKEKIQEAS